MGKLNGKVAILTGGEGSIGMAAARTLAGEGARVFLAGISESGLIAGAAAPGAATAAWSVTDVTGSAQGSAAPSASWPAMSSFMTGATLAVDGGMSS
jgi:NAD(P)-dependent dehydrogenase (short-subunit alcohol dehydrogenase family)